MFINLTIPVVLYFVSRGEAGDRGKKYGVANSNSRPKVSGVIGTKMDGKLLSIGSSSKPVNIVRPLAERFGKMAITSLFIASMAEGHASNYRCWAIVGLGWKL